MPRAPLPDHSWLNYELHGEGPPVIMIMGFAANLGAWMGQVELLHQDHQLAIFDNRGIGESGPFKGLLSIRKMARDTLALMDHLGWAEAHVVGISMGGMIAQEVALRARHRVRSLCLLTTHAGGRGPGPLPPPAGLALFSRQQVATVLGNEAARARLMLELIYPPEVLDGPVGRLSAEHIGTAMAGQAHTRTLAAQVMAVTAHSARRRLPRLEGLPTTIVRAAKDRLISPRAQSRLHRAMPWATLLDLRTAGHGAIAQCAEQIAQAIREQVAEGEALDRPIASGA